MAVIVVDRINLEEQLVYLISSYFYLILSFVTLSINSLTSFGRIQD